MGRKKRPTDAEIRQRLTTVKTMVAGMKDAMPTMRAELQREACESIDDLIGELA